MHIATALRRLADRLAPPGVGDCGSGSTLMWVGPVIQHQVFTNDRFDDGQSWSPA
jgi:hypothetical protein